MALFEHQGLKRSYVFLLWLMRTIVSSEKRNGTPLVSFQGFFCFLSHLPIEVLGLQFVLHVQLLHGF